MGLAANRTPSRVALVALGCRVNRADVDALACELGAEFEVVREGPADFVVVNTCSITGDADSAARQAVRRAAREHPGARIVAAGCYAEIGPESLASLPGVAAVVGARSQTSLAGVLGRLRSGESGDEAVVNAAQGAPGWSAVPLAPARHTRPFFKVQDGCDQRCAYCVVPLARGPSRSLSFEEALSGLALLGERHHEVVITGVHLGGFGRDLARPRSLSDLVRQVVRHRLVHRLRLSSIEPNEFPLDLLRDRDTAGALCEHFHVPLQSGSPRLLEAMRRPYRVEEFATKIEEIAARVPGACIGTDVMAGFPGETDEDHHATVALVGALPLAYLHVFPFSARPGTRAAELSDTVPRPVVRERVRELLDVSDRKWRAFLAAQAGRELEVVVERVDGGLARGTARRWVTVRWPAARDQRGALARVRVEASDGAECLGVRAEAFEARIPP